MVFQVTAFLKASQLYSEQLRTLSPRPIYVSNPSQPQNFHLLAEKKSSGSMRRFSSSLPRKKKSLNATKNKTDILLNNKETCCELVHKAPVHSTLVSRNLNYCNFTIP